MKSSKFYKTCCFLAISLLVIATSCVKKGERTSPTEAAENNAFAEAQFNDITTLIDQAMLTGTVTYGSAGSAGNNGINGILSSPCVEVMLDTVSNPRIVSINFGSTNCLCLDGRLRRGKILATFTGRYRDVNAVITTSFIDYYVNDYKIAGTKKVTNQGLNQGGKLVYKVEVSGNIIKPIGGEFSWTSIRFREWKEGSNTPLNVLDDVYGINGTASGTTVDGNQYTISINQELIRKMNCSWFESGKIELSPNGLPKIMLDYGQTGCDDNAYITVLGSSYPVKLH